MLSSLTTLKKYCKAILNASFSSRFSLVDFCKQHTLNSCLKYLHELLKLFIIIKTNAIMMKALMMFQLSELNVTK